MVLIMMIRREVTRAVVGFAALANAFILVAASPNHPRSELIGVWRGSSVCTDRIAAPACKDEIVVYAFSPASNPEIVHWTADRVVDGKRHPMGEFDLAYDRSDACWRAEFTSPRVHMVWCVTVEGTELKGTAWLLPGKQIVRKIEARRD
jgi:hypothetical protein